MAADHTHPRLFFTQRELETLRAGKDEGLRGKMWRNIRTSAEWCRGRPLRREWIAPIADDPIYENLYDRFYAMMHDMAVAEYLAFAYVYQQEEWMLTPARAWLSALCRVWIREAEGDPDAGKAYAAMRVLKGIAVSYDLLAPDLAKYERDEARTAIVTIARKYFDFFADKTHNFHKDGGYEPHHASVEAASLGVAALAVLGEERDAAAWLDFITRAHTDWLLPHALVPCGTHNQTSNFWISITQYRISFMDPLRRVTGLDLFKSFAKQMGGDIALAACAGKGPRHPDFDQTNESWIIGPSYGQIDYASPVLMFLAREYRRPIYQHLASWDMFPGVIQKTRYVGRRGDMMLFNWGAYAYAWYDPSVPAEVEPELPRSFLFLDANTNPILEVNETYARASYEHGGLSFAMQRGALVVHAAGLPVLIDFLPTWPPRSPVKDVKLVEDGDKATISCTGVEDSGFRALTLTLHRPNRLVIRRETSQPWKLWCAGSPQRSADELRWPEGVTVKATRGRVASFDPRGYTEEKIVGMGKLKMVDPFPTTYGVVEFEPSEGEIVIEVEIAPMPSPSGEAAPGRGWSPKATG